MPRVKKIDPLIYEMVPFEELPNALDLLGSRETYGEFVIEPGS